MLRERLLSFNLFRIAQDGKCRFSSRFQVAGALKDNVIISRDQSKYV